ncbi:MAG: acyltransferase family protein [Actinomycetota bacterium]|jgi:peptidoglycan/LPS O-acetylase OafA/YrhL|nr:acyltransferase family protein [Actinomycetota bacterium]MDA3027784.1 acyltransferase family protein [Actinomycetota bacterium]
MSEPTPGRGAEPTLSSVPYLPGLDGLRALAVVAVMVYHADPSWLPGGFLGVEVFFVLSGYLITLLLMAETERKGRVSLGSFWMRRARRLLPALFAVLAAVTMYTAVFTPAYLGRLRGDVVAGVLYVSNWFQLWVGAGYASSGDFAPLRHLWSLAVEEQFYLLWPLVMLILLRRGTRQLGRTALGLAGAAVIITAITTLAYHSGPIGECSVTPDAYWTIGGRCISIADGLYLSTVTRSSGLLLGAAFAMLWRPVAVMRSPLRRRPLMLDLVGALGLVLLIVLVNEVHYLTSDAGGAGIVADGRLMRGGFLITAVATIAVIVPLVHRRSMLNRLLSNAPLLWVGTRSYGLYLYHWPVYQVLRSVAGVPLGLARFIVAMVLTAVIAEVSYRFLEMPIRRGEPVLRREALARPELRRVMTGITLVVTLLGVFSVFRLATADLELNEIEASIAAGQQEVTSVEELLGEVTVSPSDGVTTDTSSSAEPGESATSDTVAIAAQREPVQFLAIGDSVMLGAAGVLRERGYTVNAEQNRQLSGTLDFLRQLRDFGTFGDVLVVHLGTNGPIGAANLDEFLDIVADVPMVVMLNVRGEVAWRDSNNELLASVDGPDDNLIVVDWLTESQNCSGACFASDDIHLSADGQVFYADAIRNVTGL